MRRGAILAGVFLACAALALPAHAQPKQEVTLQEAFPELPATREEQHEKVLEAGLKAKAAMQAVVDAGRGGDTPAYRKALKDYSIARAGYDQQIMLESYYDPAVFRAEQNFMETYANYTQVRVKVNDPGPLEDHVRAVAAANAAQKATMAARRRFLELREPAEAEIRAQANRDLGNVYLPDTDAHILWAKGMTAPPEPQPARAPSGIDTKVEQPTLPPTEVFTPSGGAPGGEEKAPSPQTPPKKPAPPHSEISDELRPDARVATNGAAAGPSALETAVLDEINRVRGDPQHYVLNGRGFPGAQVATARAFLRTASSLPPLELDDRLSAAAGRQLADQGPRGEDNHTGSDGSTPMKRMQDAGFWSSVTAEVIAVGEPTEAGAVAQLLVDPPHRDALFDHLLRSAGVACGANARFGSMCVVDLAGAPVPR